MAKYDKIVPKQDDLRFAEVPVWKNGEEEEEVVSELVLLIAGGEEITVFSMGLMGPRKATCVLWRTHR